MLAHNLMQGKLQQLEEALLAASVGGLAADGNESGAWWGGMLCCAGLRFLAWQLPTECKLESRDAYVLIPPRVANHPTPIFPTALCRGRGQRRGGRGPGQRGRLASRQRRHLPHPGAQQHVSTRLAWRRCASAVCASAVSARSQKWCTAVAAAYAAYAATCPAALSALCADSHTSCCFFS